MPTSTKSGRDGRSGTCYLALLLVQRVALPVVLVGIINCVYAIAALPWLQARLWVIPWGGMIVLLLVLGWLASRITTSLIGRGSLRHWFNRESRRLYALHKWHLLLVGEEVPVDATILVHQQRKVLLVLTSDRLVVATFNRWGNRVESVTDCERHAIVSAQSREVPVSRWGWLQGVVPRAGIVLSITGIKEPQLLEFLEPGSMVRMLALLQGQNRLTPEKNGIRQIIYSAKRNALKRRYVESLFQVKTSAFNSALIMSLFFPGLGQIRQQRFVSGLTFMLAALAC